MPTCATLRAGRKTAGASGERGRAAWCAAAAAFMGGIACGGQVGAVGTSSGRSDASSEPDGLSSEGMLTTLASAPTEITSLAVDSTGIYWTEGFGGWAVGAPYPMDGTVRRAAQDGSNGVTLATSQRYPGAIALGASEVFWANGMFGASDGWIMRVSPEAGVATTFASPQNAISIAIDEANVYWTVVGALLREPTAGGKATTLASDGGTRGHLALDAAALYWGTRDGVVKIWLDGGAAAPLAVGHAAGLMALDSTDLYWIADNPPTLMKTPIDGGASTPIASVSNTVGGLATDGISVYWTDTVGGSVLKMGVDAGATVTLASGQGGPTALAIDSKSVYWINDTANRYDIVKLTPR
jgi:hypothetical protein